MKKRILSLTGTRADYGIYKPVYDALRLSQTLDLGVIVTGMHLLPQFGRTLDGLRADAVPIIAELPTLTTEDTPRSMAEYIARTIAGCTAILSEHRPDLVFLLGDRGEMLAGAIAALELGIPIAHLHGGETTGHIDDPVRHAITHMATIHLTTAETHAANVRRMLGHSSNIHVVGAPALDTVLSFTPTPKDVLSRDAGLDPSLPVLLVVQHPDSTDPLSPAAQLQPTLDALATYEGSIVIIGANADAGGMTMNAMLEAFTARKENCLFALSLPHQRFLSWEACADILLGNSSSGIIEAASLHLPAVNVGNRQRGRLRSGNVIDVPYDAGAIGAALHRLQHDTAFRASLTAHPNAYGDGHAAQRIVAILEQYLSSAHSS